MRPDSMSQNPKIWKFAKANRIEIGGSKKSVRIYRQLSPKAHVRIKPDEHQASMQYFKGYSRKVGGVVGGTFFFNGGI